MCAYSKFALVDSGLSPSRNLDQYRLGKNINNVICVYDQIFQISHNATCEEAIAKFLNRKVSCLPLLDDDQNFVGSVTKVLSV